MKIIGRIIGETRARLTLAKVLLPLVVGSAIPGCGREEIMRSQPKPAGSATATASFTPTPVAKIIPPLKPLVQPLRDKKINETIRKSYEGYLERNIEKVDNTHWRPLQDADGSDLDLDGDIDERLTVSEASAYVMLRASWMDDRQTFTNVWNWTRDNLQRKNLKTVWTCEDDVCDQGTWIKKKDWIDEYRQRWHGNGADHLFAWRWIPDLNGENKDGTLTKGGVIFFQDPFGEEDRSGINAASDDLEIAVALYLASLRGWGNASEYLDEAKLIAKDAWDKYVVMVNGDPILFAGDQFAWTSEVNPSYSRPFYFEHVFPLIDPDHPWKKLAKTSYDLTIKSGQVSFDNLAGVNLPTNWAAVNHRGEVVESKTFPGPAGRIFGHDAFRALFAVAQDSAWSGDSSARDYLTDCQVGPRCFLEQRANLIRGYEHNGGPVTPNEEIGQTQNLNNEPYAFYGGLLPFFYYGGNKALAQKFLDRLNTLYDPALGCWADDCENYYYQNWIWFGLTLVNSYPSLDNLMTLLAKPPRPARKEAQVELAPLPPFLHLDPRLGREAFDDDRPILDPDRALDELSVEQIKETLAAISAVPYVPLTGEKNRFDLFTRIDQIDHKYTLSLLPFLENPSEYGNTLITLLAVYKQKIIEENKKKELAGAIAFCQKTRANIKSPIAADRRLFTPNPYSRAALDLTEAELRSQVTKEKDGFYREGIRLAVSAMMRIRQFKSPEAAPDYYQVAKGFYTIANLYLQLHENNKKKTLEYQAEAIKYFEFAIQARGGLKEQINDPKTKLKLAFISADIDEALDTNQKLGHLPEVKRKLARRALDYLWGMALVSKTSLFTQQKGEIKIEHLLPQIENCDKAIAVLKAVADETNQLMPEKKNKEDFFVAFAGVVKGELRLFLVDRIKYYLWPTKGQNLGDLNRTLTELERKFKIAAPKTYAATSKLDRTIERLFNLTDGLIAQAQELFRAVPPKFVRLYETAQIKLNETLLRLAQALDHEYRYLRPLTFNEAIKDNPIPDDEYLGIARNYYIAIFLAATKNPQDGAEAEALFKKVLAKAQEKLERPSQLYFQAHVTLKRGEIAAQKKDYKGALNLYGEAQMLIEKIERLPEAELKNLAFRPASFRAELYNEWASSLEVRGFKVDSVKMAKKALRACYESDSKYDFETRRLLIVALFGLEKEDESLQKEFGRIPL